jgi:hypothetical protein
MASWNRKDLTGQVRGRLTIIDFAFIQEGQAFWNCRCECGAVVVRSRHVLTRIVSCGCFRREMAAVYSQKGREARRGTALRSATKLTADQALAIRLEYANSDITRKQLAAKYGVGTPAIRSVLLGTNWKDAGGPLSKSEDILTPDSVRAIREEYRKGRVRQADLATKYGVSEATINMLLSRRIWKHVSDLDEKNIEKYQSALLKPIDPNRRLSDTDAARIFGLCQALDGGLIE